MFQFNFFLIFKSYLQIKVQFNLSFPFIFICFFLTLFLQFFPISPFPRALMVSLSLAYFHLNFFSTWHHDHWYQVVQAFHRHETLSTDRFIEIVQASVYMICQLFTSRLKPNSLTIFRSSLRYCLKPTPSQMHSLLRKCRKDSSRE